MPNSEIAAAIERGITSQSELITSLSLLVIGGLLAFLLQLRMHNAVPKNTEIKMKWYPLFCIALVCASISIALGYLLTGMLIEMAPQIFGHTFVKESAFSEQNFSPAPVENLKIFSLAQFGFFCSGIVSGCAFVLKNRH